jgi:hypothetical protein
VSNLPEEIVRGLRLLADMVEQNPHLAENFRHTLQTSGLNLHLYGDERAAQMAEIARITRKFGATTTKDVFGDMHNVLCDFGFVKLDILARRTEVCERVVVDTVEVVEEVPDPEVMATVPKVTVVRTEEVVEWQCRPLLEAAEAVSS